MIIQVSSLKLIRDQGLDHKEITSSSSKDNFQIPQNKEGSQRIQISQRTPKVNKEPALLMKNNKLNIYKMTKFNKIFRDVSH